MPATPLRVEITAKDIAGLRKPREERDYDYNVIEVPGDYEAILVDVNDHESTRTGNKGWKFSYEVMGCPFDDYVMHTKSAKWKVLSTMEALGFPIEEGVENFDPNAYIGGVVGAHIDWQTPEEDLEDGAPNYREIKDIFSLEGVDVVSEEEAIDEDLAEDDVPAL